jgi:uncharacterized protein YnzC (UPF0291/DUF896 family)
LENVKEIKMEQAKLDRINALAKKKKEGTLTEEEAIERAALHQEYINEIRLSFGAILDNTVIEYPDGTRKVLKKDKGGE